MSTRCTLRIAFYPHRAYVSDAHTVIDIIVLGVRVGWVGVGWVLNVPVQQLPSTVLMLPCKYLQTPFKFTLNVIFVPRRYKFV